MPAPLPFWGHVCAPRNARGWWRIAQYFMSVGTGSPMYVGYLAELAGYCIRRDYWWIAEADKILRSIAYPTPPFLQFNWFDRTRFTWNNQGVLNAWTEQHTIGGNARDTCVWLQYKANDTPRVQLMAGSFFFSETANLAKGTLSSGFGAVDPTLPLIDQPALLQPGPMGIHSFAAITMATCP